MIALDTSALLWAVQAKPGSHVDDARLAAIQAIASGLFLLPAPALAEYLHGVPSLECPRAVQLLGRFATVVPFDYRAATICADLFRLPRGRQTKQAFKVDAMILATAIAHGATHLIQNDADFVTLADGQQINLVSVESIKVQPTLLDGAPKPQPKP